MGERGGNDAGRPGERNGASPYPHSVGGRRRVGQRPGQPCSAMARLTARRREKEERGEGRLGWLGRTVHSGPASLAFSILFFLFLFFPAFSKLFWHYLIFINCVTWPTITSTIFSFTRNWLWKIRISSLFPLNYLVPNAAVCHCFN